MTERISREQAWCKLAVFIAEGGPAPEAITFDESGPLIRLASSSDLSYWVGSLGAGRSSTSPSGEVGEIVQSAHLDDWHGMEVFLLCRSRVLPLDVDMSAVRAVAEGDTTDVVI